MRGLVTLGAILLTVGALAVWVNRVVLQTNTWTDTSRARARRSRGPADDLDLPGRSAVRQRRCRRAAARRASPRAKPLATPAAAALRDVFARGAQRVLASPQAQTAWRAANRRAQSQLVKLLDGGGGALTTTNGEVVLDLHPIVERVAGRVGGGGAIPASAGTIVLLRSDQLKLAQDTTQALKRIAIILVPLVLLIFVLAIWVAPDRRRAVRNVAIAILVSGLVLVFVRRVFGDQLIDRLVKDTTIRPAVHHVWWIATDQLRLAITSILFVGIVGLIGAWVAGPGARATSVRRSLAGFLRDDRSWIAFAAVVPPAARVGTHAGGAELGHRGLVSHCSQRSGSRRSGARPPASSRTPYPGRSRCRRASPETAARHRRRPRTPGSTGSDGSPSFTRRAC